MAQNSRNANKPIAFALPVAGEHPPDMSGMAARCKLMMIPEILKNGLWVMEDEGEETRMMKARKRVYIPVLVK